MEKSEEKNSTQAKVRRPVTWTCEQFPSSAVPQFSVALQTFAREGEKDVAAVTTTATRTTEKEKGNGNRDTQL